MNNLIKRQQEIDNEINQEFQSYERKYEKIDERLEGVTDELLRRRSFVNRSKYLSDLSQQCYGDILQLVSRSVESNDFENAHYILRSLYTNILSLYKKIKYEIVYEQEDNENN